MDFAVMLSEQAILERLLKKDIDIVIVGVEHLSHRMKETYDLKTIETMTDLIHQHNKFVYLNMNALLHHNQLSLLEEAFGSLNELEIDGILFADLAVYQVAKRYDLQHLLIYYPETYLTSDEDVRFWKAQDIKSVIMGRELTLKDIESIGKQKIMPLTHIGHGYLNMFHSRRPLVENFFKFTKDEDPDTIKDKTNLTIVEEIRDEAYPIVQDSFGTHVYRAKPLASFNDFDVIKTSIDTFVIDTLFYDEKEIIEIIDDYLAFNQSKNKAIINKYASSHDDGFYHKKTIYLDGKGEGQ